MPGLTGTIIHDVSRTAARQWDHRRCRSVDKALEAPGGVPVLECHVNRLSSVASSAGECPALAVPPVERWVAVVEVVVVFLPNSSHIDSLDEPLAVASGASLAVFGMALHQCLFLQDDLTRYGLAVNAATRKIEVDPGAPLAGASWGSPPCQRQSTSREWCPAKWDR